MNLSVIFHGDWEVYAHRDPVSGKRELLQEHIVRCEKYRIRISQERKLLKIEENFLTKLGLDKDDFAGKLVKEMIDAVILFHDLGKGTPAFQKNKMGNPNTIPTKYWGDDSSHSFLSAFLYLDFYLYEIKNGFNKVEKEQKKALIALAWELSYVIAKHHSNFESMEAYLGEQSEWQLKLLTGDDSIYERESILKPIRENVWKKVILISTQIVEAGVDIDMDIGYKDISKLDSEEQFLGRIARSGIKNGIPGIVYFFNLDQAEKIYRDDYRMEKSLTLGNEEMRTVLKEKRFQTYYEQVMHYLKEMKNRKTSEDGLEYFFSESLKKLDFLKIQKRMELIEEDCWHVDIILCRKLVMEDGTEKDGRKIWEHYKELLSDYQMDYSEKKVKLSECQSDLNLFRYQIKRNIQIPYNEMIGELYCVYDGEQYFQDEKIDREKLEGDHMYFIDL